MSERSPNLSSVDVFVDWAKARLDEMGAMSKSATSARPVRPPGLL